MPTDVSREYLETFTTRNTSSAKSSASFTLVAIEDLALPEVQRGPIRRFLATLARGFRTIGGGLEWCFGTVVLIVGIAVLAAVPI